MIATDAPSTTPTIDATAIETYIDLVFGYLEGLVPIRAFSETGTPSQTPVTELLAPGDGARNPLAPYRCMGPVALLGRLSLGSRRDRAHPGTGPSDSAKGRPVAGQTGRGEEDCKPQDNRSDNCDRGL